jgi:hypothetical protein
VSSHLPGSRIVMCILSSIFGKFHCSLSSQVCRCAVHGEHHAKLSRRCRRCVERGTWHTARTSYVNRSAKDECKCGCGHNRPSMRMRESLGHEHAHPATGNTEGIDTGRPWSWLALMAQGSRHYILQEGSACDRHGQRSDGVPRWPPHAHTVTPTHTN